MKGSVIMARENWPGAPIKEVCRCNGFAEDIRNALADYTITGSQGTRIHKYNHVEIFEVSARKPKEPSAQMKKPRKNIRCIPASEEPKIIANLQTVFAQIDAMRAGNGEQTAPQGQTAETGPALSQRKTEADQ